MSQESLSIRECARRLGVSDTAVHKALRAGRVAKDAQGGMPWPETERRWHANSDAAKRTHAGSQGSPRRATDLPVSAPPPAAEAALSGGLSYAQSRAVREAFAARLAKLDYEQKAGKLVNADEVKVQWFKLVTAAKTRILGIPAAVKQRAADLPLSVVNVIDEICREALEDLANGRD